MSYRSGTPWDELEFFCSTCGANRHEPCRTLTGHVCRPHAPRIDAANEVWIEMHPREATPDQ